MKRVFFAVLASTLAIATWAFAQEKDACAEFMQLVKQTYNFDVLRLSDKQKMAKEKDLDHFWKTVSARKKEFLPCLRAAVEDPASNSFFRYDGSNLLVTIDPAMPSKKLQSDIYTATDLDVVGARRWVAVLSERGTEGFDISRAAERWLTDKKAHYTVPEHGDFEVDTYRGALFLYGSMNEAQATPALLKIVAQPAHPGREIALALLMLQATPEAMQALKKLDATGFPKETQQVLKEFLADPQLIKPRAQPKTSRAEFVQALQAITKGDGSRFFALAEKVEDGERDAAAVLKPEDLPLLRKVRRLFMLGGNQHSMSYYNDFTGIIMAVLQKSAPVQ